MTVSRAENSDLTKKLMSPRFSKEANFVPNITMGPDKKNRILILFRKYLLWDVKFKSNQCVCYQKKSNFLMSKKGKEHC